MFAGLKILKTKPNPLVPSKSTSKGKKSSSSIHALSAKPKSINIATILAWTQLLVGSVIFANPRKPKMLSKNASFANAKVKCSSSLMRTDLHMYIALLPAIWRYSKILRLWSSSWILTLNRSSQKRETQKASKKTFINAHFAKKTQTKCSNATILNVTLQHTFHA